MTTKHNNTLSENSIAFIESITTKKLTLGNLLWSIRECEELSQIEFAKIIGISRQYLCDIEHNRRTVSPKAAADFASKLGHSPLQFIRLALQDELHKYGFNIDIQLTENRAA